MSDIRRLRIAVIGDLILDEFLWGEATRISPEAPVPVVLLERETQSLGGAGNVVANLSALGAEVVAIGVVGDDEAGRTITAQLRQSGANTDYIERDAGRQSTVKQRIMARGKHLVRVDRESVGPVHPSVTLALLRSISEASAHLDAILVSDYLKGVVTQKLMLGIAEVCCTRDIPLLVDPKNPRIIYRGATVLKPNRKELQMLAGAGRGGHASIEPVAERVRRKHAAENLVVTLGAEGMLVCPGKGAPYSVPTVARNVVDVTGAGDTVLACLGLAIAAGWSLREAVQLANRAAGIVVSRPGTVAIDVADLGQVSPCRRSLTATAGRS